MRLSWKLFFITTPIFVLFLTIFGIWIIQDSFDHSLSQAVEQCMAENTVESDDDQKGRSELP